MWPTCARLPTDGSERLCGTMRLVRQYAHRPLRVLCSSAAVSNAASKALGALMTKAQGTIAGAATAAATAAVASSAGAAAAGGAAGGGGPSGAVSAIQGAQRLGATSGPQPQMPVPMLCMCSRSTEYDTLPGALLWCRLLRKAGRASSGR